MGIFIYPDIPQSFFFYPTRKCCQQPMKSWWDQRSSEISSETGFGLVGLKFSWCGEITEMILMDIFWWFGCHDWMTWLSRTSWEWNGIIIPTVTNPPSFFRLGLVGQPPTSDEKRRLFSMKSQHLNIPGLVICYIAIENDHGNSGFSHWKRWIFP